MNGCGKGSTALLDGPATPEGGPDADFGPDFSPDLGSVFGLDAGLGDEFEDEFALDVRVVVALAPVGMSFCPTDDGCGNTCSGNDSTCNSFVDDPA